MRSPHTTTKSSPRSPQLEKAYKLEGIEKEYKLEKKK